MADETKPETPADTMPVTNKPTVKRSHHKTAKRHTKKANKIKRVKYLATKKTGSRIPTADHEKLLIKYYKLRNKGMNKDEAAAKIGPHYMTLYQWEQDLGWSFKLWKAHKLPNGKGKLQVERGEKAKRGRKRVAKSVRRGPKARRGRPKTRTPRASKQTKDVQTIFPYLKSTLSGTKVQLLALADDIRKHFGID